MKTKIGLICSYIINGLLELAGLLLAGAIIVEFAGSKANGEESIFVAMPDMRWLIVIAAFAIIWSGFYLVYYIRNRKHFTNKNLD